MFFFLVPFVRWTRVRAREILSSTGGIVRIIAARDSFISSRRQVMWPIRNNARSRRPKSPDDRSALWGNLGELEKSPSSYFSTNRRGFNPDRDLQDREIWKGLLRPLDWLMRSAQAAELETIRGEWELNKKPSLGLSEIEKITETRAGGIECSETREMYKGNICLWKSVGRQLPGREDG